MIGAIWAAAAFAVLAPTLPTIGNFAIASDFAHYQSDQDEMVFYSPLAIQSLTCTGRQEDGRLAVACALW